MPEDLAALERRIRALAAMIGAPADALPTFGTSLQDGRPHVEVRATYDLVRCERGREFDRRSTAELDEVLYWSLECATFAMAVDFERKHRRRGEDFRRQLFDHQERLLGLLSDRWRARKAEDHRRILGKAPFDDAVACR